MPDGTCLLSFYCYNVVQKFLVRDGLLGGEVITLRGQFHIAHLDYLDYLLSNAHAIDEAELGPFIVSSDRQRVFVGLDDPFEGAPEATGVIEWTNHIGQSQTNIGQGPDSFQIELALHFILYFMEGTYPQVSLLRGLALIDLYSCSRSISSSLMASRNGVAWLLYTESDEMKTYLSAIFSIALVTLCTSLHRKAEKSTTQDHFLSGVICRCWLRNAMVAVVSLCYFLSQQKVWTYGCYFLAQLFQQILPRLTQTTSGAGERVQRESRRAFPMKFVPPRISTRTQVSIICQKFIIDVCGRPTIINGAISKEKFLNKSTNEYGKGM